jgi:uncharacterized protein (TIGR00255 family)
MIRSMTGYGKATLSVEGKVTTIEIRSVNSKQLDLNLRLPSILKDKEAELRSLLGSRFERGKIDFMVGLESVAGTTHFTIDKELAASYYHELKDFADQQGISNADFLSILTRLPEVIKAGADEVSGDDWKHFLEGVESAVQQFDKFRLDEGKVLEKDFHDRILKILNLLEKTGNFEKQRVLAIKERIRKNLREFMESENFDENRFEQELFYYIERLDITEEKIRLKKHCDYFLESLKDQENNGKKLSFITQEIGREINTLGSKANDAEIQKIVVEMKDELEKIKEQMLNIL